MFGEQRHMVGAATPQVNLRLLEGSDLDRLWPHFHLPILRSSSVIADLPAREERESGSSA